MIAAYCRRLVLRQSVRFRWYCVSFVVAEMYGCCALGTEHHEGFNVLSMVVHID